MISSVLKRFLWLLIIWGLVCSQGFADTIGVNVSACIQAFAHVIENAKRTVTSPFRFRSEAHRDQREFIEKAFLPLVGQGGIYEVDLTDKSKKEREWVVVSKDEMILKVPESRDIVFHWKEGIKTPRKKIRSGRIILEFPKGYDFGVHPDDGADLLRRMLMGHKLQPFTHDVKAREERRVLEEPEIFLKGAQVQGAHAAEEAILRGDDSFLLVGSTGLGKTEILKRMILSLVKHKSKKLHVLMAHEVDLVKQLHGDMEDLLRNQQKEGRPPPFILKKWGGEEGSESITELIASIERSPVPVLLVTIDKSFINRVDAREFQIKKKKTKELDANGDDVKELPEKKMRTKEQDAQRKFNLTFLSEQLGSLVVDEAHHIGAPQTMDLINDLRKEEDRDWFLGGFTATPQRQDMDFIKELFHGKGFYTNRDTHESYGKIVRSEKSPGVENFTDDEEISHVKSGEGEAYRTTGQILDQLEITIQKGELTPIDKMIYLNPEHIQEGDIPLFLPSRQIEAENTRGHAPVIESYEDEEQSGKGDRRALNPHYYGKVLPPLYQLSQKHKQGFFCVGGVQATEDVRSYLQDLSTKVAGRKLRIASLHSKIETTEAKRVEHLRRAGLPLPDWMKNALPTEDTYEKKIRGAFSRGEIDVLITVKMLDEGINFPNMSLYVDLNQKVPVKQRLQRMGRVLRIKEDKFGATVVGFAHQDADTLRDELQLVERFRDGKLSHKESEKGEKDEDGKDEGEKEIGIEGLNLFGKLALSPEEYAKTLHESPFFSRSKQKELSGEQHAHKLIEDILTQSSRTDFELDGTAYFHQRISYDRLAGFLDESIEQGGQEREGFFNVISGASPEIKKVVAEIKRRRQRTKRLIQTPEGTAQLINEFVSRYRKIPRDTSSKALSEKGTRDEEKLKQEFDRHKKDLIFMTTITPDVGKTIGIYKEFKVQPGTPAPLFNTKGIIPSPEVLAKLQNEKEVTHWINEFYSHYKRLPNKDRMGLEGWLGKILEERAQKEKFEGLSDDVALLTMEAFPVKHEEKSAGDQDKKPKLSKLTLPPGIAPGPLLIGEQEIRLQQKIESLGNGKRAQLLSQLEIYRQASRDYEDANKSREERAKIETTLRMRESLFQLFRQMEIDPKTQPSAVLIISSSDTRSLRRTEGLVTFYEEVARSMAQANGWKVDAPVRSEKGYTLKVTGVGAYSFFMQQNGLHQVEENDDGKKFTTPVHVRVQGATPTEVTARHWVVAGKNITSKGKKPDMVTEYLNRKIKELGN